MIFFKNSWGLAFFVLFLVIGIKALSRMGTPIPFVEESQKAPKKTDNRSWVDFDNLSITSFENDQIVWQSTSHDGKASWPGNIFVLHNNAQYFPTYQLKLVAQDATLDWPHSRYEWAGKVHLSAKSLGELSTARVEYDFSNQLILIPSSFQLTKGSYTLEGKGMSYNLQTKYFQIQNPTDSKP